MEAQGGVGPVEAMTEPLFPVQGYALAPERPAPAAYCLPWYHPPAR